MGSSLLAVSGMGELVESGGSELDDDEAVDVVRGMGAQARMLV